MGDKLKAKYFVDLVMFLTLLLTASSGLINLYRRFFHGRVFGMSGFFWISFHAVFAITTVILILIHLGMHFDWIKFSSKKIFGPENKNKE